MASSVWKGYITFGLISVPIRLFAAARESHVSFHQIHTECGGRIKQQIYCPTCERVVERSELAKGYPLDSERNVLVTSEELKALEPESSENMNILEFVKLAEVDPIYYQTSYYTAPEDSGKRAYALLFQGMQQMGLAAVAKVTMHQREQVVIVRPYDRGLLLHTIYYPEEVREIPEYGSQGELKLQPEEVELAEQFMKRLIGKFDPSQFQDEYEAKVREMVESKQAGALAKATQAHKPRGQVINLMDALKKSLQEQTAAPSRKKAPQRETRPAKPAAAGRKKAV